MNNGQKSLSINETFIIEGDSDGILSACTGLYTSTIISCFGDTKIDMGVGVISTTSSFSASTFYGDGSNLTGISTQDTYVTGGTYSSGTAIFTNNTGGTFSVTGFNESSITACTSVFTNNLVSCSGNTSLFLEQNQIVNKGDIIPIVDDYYNLGTTLTRFREINTVSGNSTVFTSSIKINTPILDLGLDSENNSRQINANNSIIQNDILLGGSY